MKIKINNKSHDIKFASQLTTGEYIDYMASLSEKTGTFEQLINYIAVVTKTDNTDVSKISIDDESIRRLSVWIGQVPQINEFPELDRFYYKKKARTIYKKSLNWRTLGARKMLEEKGLDNSMKQSVYLLAIYASDSYDNDKVEEIYNELLDYEAEKVFGFIVFFFTKLMSGTKPVKAYWPMRKLIAFINILKLSKK